MTNVILISFTLGPLIGAIVGFIIFVGIEAVSGSNILFNHDTNFLDALASIPLLLLFAIAYAYFWGGPISLLAGLGLAAAFRMGARPGYLIVILAPILVILILIIALLPWVGLSAFYFMTLALPAAASAALLRYYFRNLASDLEALNYYKAV